MNTFARFSLFSLLSHPPRTTTSRLRRGLPWLVAASLGAIALPLVSLPSQAAKLIPATERQALVRLYQRTQGAQWTQQAGWMGRPGTECDWYGVRCGADRRHVVGLDLANNQLRGQLPPLDGLAHLRDLSLALNYLEGPLPPLHGLLQLRSLTAHNNLLRGPLPDFQHLRQLERVVLANNQIDRALPPLSGLAALREFDVSNNRLVGPAPDARGLPQLQRFDISFNPLVATPAREASAWRS